MQFASTHIITGTDERTKFRNEAATGLLFQLGRADEPNSEFANYSLMSLARRCLELRGLQHTGNPLEIVGRAMNEGDFPAILANVANKVLVESFDTANETWRDWCATGVVRDFKDVTVAGLSEFEDLDQIVNDTGYKFGNVADAGETFSMATYGKMYAFTRRAIINDDLGALADAITAHGETVARKIGDVAYSVLTGNPAMRDGVALFHADHKNLGTANPPTEVTLAEGIAKMKLQTDILGQRKLNIRPQYFIAPAALEGSAELFFASNQFSGDTKDSTRANIYAGNRFTRIYDPRLDDASSTAWYLAGPKGKTVKVFFLSGYEKPYIETQNGWESDGIEFKVRIDVAAKAIDWRALYKNAGA